MKVDKAARVLVIAAARKQGVPAQVIARGLGISRSAVYRAYDQAQARASGR